MAGSEHLKESSRYRIGRNLRAASLGVFLVLVGVFLIVYPLVAEIRAFLSDLSFVPLFDQVYYPAPSSPHPLFYHILRNFFMAWSVWLGILTIVQLATKGRARRVAHTLGDCVFWIGAAYLLDRIGLGALAFGSFLALLVVVAGVSLIIRALTILSLDKLRY